MALLKIQNIKISGISACVPHNILENSNPDFVETTGIEEHRISTRNICASDLCLSSAEKLITELNWDKGEIQALIFVSQTPDYNCVPATSCLLQNKLGLSKNCCCFDVSLGCSGWVYGMSVISSLMSSGGIKKGLLLAGDTPLKFCSPKDKSSYPLFGDAGTTTALEFDLTCSPMYFNLNTDGSGFNDIIIPGGGYRNPVLKSSLEEFKDVDGMIRNNLQLKMDGMNIFSFGISKVYPCIDELINFSQLDKKNINYYVFHQANKLMLKKIQKKLMLNNEQVPFSIDKFGNTSCASIPLTIVTQLRDVLTVKRSRIICCGFGVGLSLGSVYFEVNGIKIPKLLEM